MISKRTKKKKAKRTATNDIVVHRKKTKKKKKGPRNTRIPGPTKPIQITEEQRLTKVKPGWMRKPRPWEPQGPISHRLRINAQQFISRCCILWAHGVSDKAICFSLGINYRDFSHWVNETPDDRPIFLFTVDLWDEIQQVKCTFGQLKERMKLTFEPVYLHHLKKIISDAEEQGDVKTASSNVRWLMEKNMPRKYGKQETLNITNIPIAIRTSEDLDIEDI